MTGFRGISVWALVCLAVGLGCADTTERNGDAKPKEVESTVESEDTAEAVSTDQPVVDEPGSTVIPLDQIWANLQAGTQGIRDSDPDRFRFSVQTLEQIDPHPSPLSRQISQAIYRRSEEEQPIGPGFAVAGTGREALVAIKEIMEQDEIPSQTFPVGTEITLFFFTRDWDLGMGFGLKEVRQSNETVSIRYGFGWHGTQEIIIYNLALRRYFALIPLGKPAAGIYDVDIDRSPLEKKHLKNYRSENEEWAEKTICKPFVFTIESGNSEADINDWEVQRNLKGKNDEKKK